MKVLYDIFLPHFWIGPGIKLVVIVIDKTLVLIQDFLHHTNEEATLVVVLWVESHAVL